MPTRCTPLDRVERVAPRTRDGSEECLKTPGDAIWITRCAIAAIKRELDFFGVLVLSFVAAAC